jgi:hypothetical protein
VHTGSWWGNLREKDHHENLGTDKSTILKWILKKWDWSMDRIDLSQDTVGWQANANVVMNLQVP